MCDELQAKNESCRFVQVTNEHKKLALSSFLASLFSTLISFTFAICVAVDCVREHSTTVCCFCRGTWHPSTAICFNSMLKRVNFHHVDLSTSPMLIIWMAAVAQCQMRSSL